MVILLDKECHLQPLLGGLQKSANPDLAWVWMGFPLPSCGLALKEWKRGSGSWMLGETVWPFFPVRDGSWLPLTLSGISILLRPQTAYSSYDLGHVSYTIILLIMLKNFFLLPGSVFIKTCSQFSRKYLFVSQTRKITFLHLSYFDFQIPPLMVGWRVKRRITGWILQEAVVVMKSEV